jgi:DNA-binding PadR family transcriptional regulator
LKYKIREKKILSKFMILKVVKARPNITRYKARKIINENGCSFSFSDFYRTFNDLEERRLLLRDRKNLFSITNAGDNELEEISTLLRILLSPIF